jgi:hypothetical protein
LGKATTTGEHEAAEVKSPNTKIHGEPPAGSPMPGVENPESEGIKEERNPNTE